MITSEALAAPDGLLIAVALSYDKVVLELDI